MNSPWSTLIAAPTLLGALLSSSVDLYADLSPSVVDVSSMPAPVAELGRHDVLVRAPSRVELSRAHHTIAAPEALEIKSVDTVAFDGRTYLAVRTGTLGEKGDHAHVLSSQDGDAWRFELGLSRTAHIHGPRLLVVGGRLFAYVSIESSDSSTWAETASGDEPPTRTYAAELSATGDWSEYTDIHLDGHVVSNVKTVSGIPLMTTYIGGDAVFRHGLPPREVNLLTSSDGRDWQALQAGRQSVYRGGGSDAAFSSGQDGNLLAVVRNEAGDETGWGTSVCVAATSEWPSWDCVNDPKSYGAAATFSHDGETYLVGERQLGGSGAYDVGRYSGTLRLLRNQAEQLTTAKRCALWRYDTSTRKFVFLTDLPSRGKSCTPAVLPGAAPGRFIVYSQSSDLNGPEWSTRASNSAPSRLYRYELDFVARAQTQTVHAKR